MNSLENEKRQLAVDALLNSDTVKEYVNEEYERQRYTDKMRSFQKEEIKFTISSGLIDVTQTLIPTLAFYVPVARILH